MSDALGAVVADRLQRAVAPAIAEAAQVIAARQGAVAVLFYGSVLRSGDLDGVLDFYALTNAARRPLIWPEVSFHEVAVAGRTLRAKVATMPLATFAAAAAGGTLDTTIWARFVQPSALAWQADGAREAVVDAVADAITTAARFAALLGPADGHADDYWCALFRQTYRAEFRVEAPGRERQIVDVAPEWFATILPLAWSRGAVAFRDERGVLAPELTPAQRRRWGAAWRRRRRAGKPLNAVRLVKAAFTFAGAARYAAWKIERHTGVAVTLTPWRERHPVLAAPGVLWRVWRERSAA